MAAAFVAGDSELSAALSSAFPLSDLSDARRASVVANALTDTIIAALAESRTVKLTIRQMEAANIFYKDVVDNDALSGAEKRERIQKLLGKVVSRMESVKSLSAASGSHVGCEGGEWQLRYRVSVVTQNTFDDESVATPIAAHSADDSPVADVCATVTQTRDERTGVCTPSVLKGAPVMSPKKRATVHYASMKSMSVTLDGEYDISYLSALRTANASLIQVTDSHSADGSSAKRIAALSLGRAEENDIHTDDEFTGVSRFHAWLLFCGDKLLFFDGWSRFGSALVYRSGDEALAESVSRERHLIVLDATETALFRLGNECDVLLNPAPCRLCGEESADASTSESRVVLLDCEHPFVCAKCFFGATVKKCPLCGELPRKWDSRSLSGVTE